MLIRVLNALGFDGWLAQQPEAERTLLVARAFEIFAEAGGVPADDPQRALFAFDGAQRAHVDAGACTWQSFGWPAWLGWRAPQAAMNGRRSLRWWCAAVRRALRRSTGLTLADVVCRDSHVAITGTYIDVIFALDAVDLRLRRHGLDADPGWVPWLGRIVAFHFVDTEAAHA